MHWEQQIRYAALTDIGFRRQNNQDACVVQLCSDHETWNERGHLFVVADGMGGHAVGELASKMAVDTIPHTFDKLRHLSRKESLRTCIETANSLIHQRGLQNIEFHKMGTTCSTLLLCSEGAYIGQVGDSRVYRIRKRRIDQLSRDHSLVWELIESGRVKQSEAEQMYPRNIITRSLGPEESVQVDVEGPFPILRDDVYVICSDGLTGLLSDSEIGIIASEMAPSEASKLLVHLANLRGGNDNITVIVVRVGDVPSDLRGNLPVVTVDPDDQSNVHWWTLGGIGLTSAVFIVGLMLIAVGGHFQNGGIAIVVVSLLMAIGLFSWRLLKRRPPESTPIKESHSKVRRKPYRTASAKINEAFMKRIVHVESELNRAAREEGWAIEWNHYEEAFQRASLAMKNKAYSKGLNEYGKVFELLMAGVLQERKKLQHESRWKKGE